MRTSPHSIGRRILGASAAACAGAALLAAPTPAHAVSADPLPCAWRFMSDGQSLNVAFPDTGATYWVLPYALGPRDSLELSGAYPSARYFSLNTYGTDLDTIDTLRDDRILPDPGSANPFADADARVLPPEQRRWHATLVPGPADPARNEIRAVRADAAPIGFLILRVYVPDDPGSLSGGVPLPDVTYRLGSASLPVQPARNRSIRARSRARSPMSPGVASTGQSKRPRRVPSAATPRRRCS